MRIHVIGATVLLLTLDACSSGQNLPYYLSISPQLESQALPASQGRNDDVSCERIELSSADSVCTVNIHRIVQSVVEMNRSAPMTPKDFQNEFEGRFDSALQEIFLLHWQCFGVE